MSYSDIPGWMNYEDIYDSFVEEAADGEVIVEVGVAFGRSLAYLANRVIESKKRIRIVGVDLWADDPGWGGEFRDVVERAGSPFDAFKSCMAQHAPETLKRVKLMRKPSVEAAKAFAPGSVGFVFIDANHDYDAVKADIAAWAPLITRRGGVLAGHDHEEREFPGVVRAVREAFGAGGYEVRNTSWWRRNP